MSWADYHVHSTFSDGKHTPEEIVQAALSRGMAALGFSDHGYAPYDMDCCMPKESVPDYLRIIRGLRERYAGQIEIYCGVEQDIFSEESTESFDYVIGSVHYVRINDRYYSVDNTAEELNAAAEAFDGDIYAVVEAYYETVSHVVESTHCQMIGHFDLIAKLNERHKLFDPTHPRYVAAWRSASETLLLSGVPFEINTGAMARGYRTVPYPAPEILNYLNRRGARFVLSSDSHSADTLGYDFARQAEIARKSGLTLTQPALRTVSS